MVGPVTVAFLNSKGGVGKTTSAVNTAVALAERGKKVLLIDMDAQSHVAQHLGISVDTSKSIDAVLRTSSCPISGAVYKTRYKNLAVVPSTRSLEQEERLLGMSNRPTEALRRRLQELPSGYDIVVIDCSPSLGVLTRNAMRASDYLVITTNLNSFSVNGMDRLGHAIEEFHRDFDGSCAAVIGVLITKFDRRTGRSNRVNMETLFSSFSAGTLFDHPIRTDQKCKAAQRMGKSVLDVPSSRAAEDYRRLAGELIERMTA